MNPILQEALAGGPATVTLGGQNYPLDYPIQGVILYKNLTVAISKALRAPSETPEQSEGPNLRAESGQL